MAQPVGLDQGGTSKAVRALFATVFTLGLIQPLVADTFIVRPVPASKLTAAKALGSALVGERHCTEDRCIVLAETAAQKVVLKSLATQNKIWLQEFPEARKVYFAGAIWDGETQSFDRTFPGISEQPEGPESLFAVVFKSFPEPAWLFALHYAGFVVTEPLPTMAYMVYADREALMRFAAKAPYIYRIMEIPSGLRRSNIDTYLPGDGDGPASTLVAIVNVSTSEVKRNLVNVRGGEPSVEYRMNRIVAHSAALTRADALFLSRLPEIVSITRQTFEGGPSDERTNRIIAGDFQGPAGSSWPRTLVANTQPSGSWYWDDYLGKLSTAFSGFDLSKQTIAFFDTGIDDGLKNASGASVCPPHLTSPSGTCRLVFTSDVNSEFTNPNARADDRAGHGSLTSSIAAGYVSDQVGGRDQMPAATGHYSFTQGVAQGVNVAVTKFFGDPTIKCDSKDESNNPISYRRVGLVEPTFSDGDYSVRTRYGIVTMNGRNPLPETDFNNAPGPGASIFNHSWNTGEFIYDPVSILLDQSARQPAAIAFDFGEPSNHRVFVGTGDPILHVVATGNCYGTACPGSHPVKAPGLAKNVLTVGATQTYNQQTYTTGTESVCPTDNDETHANDTAVVARFSRGSPDAAATNFRFKPELLAPGTRSYGRRSSRYTPDGSPDFTCLLCNPDLTGSGQYAWKQGTSFATPAVSGAAALVREWLRVLNAGSFLAPFVWPSPALVKATLIASARFLTGTGGPTHEQGYGGLSLDTLFQSPSNYYFFDQRFTLPNQGNLAWEKTLTVNPGQDVAIALAWTDRFAGNGAGALVNNLDLSVRASVGADTYLWYGNTFSSGHSTLFINPSSGPPLDSVNASEKVIIRWQDLSTADRITIRVSAFSLNGSGTQVSQIGGDGIDPSLTALFPRQDFALAVINAHE